MSASEGVSGSAAPDQARTARAPATVESRSAARSPDFFIVGHPKSGTTALYEMLRGHSQIYMPESKEPWYFATELHLRPPPRPGGIARTFEEYQSLFAAAQPQQRIGEASPMYLWSATAAERIAEVREDARVIAILREPASFLHSLHLQFVRTNVETETDFRRAIELEDSRREGRNISAHSYWPKALLYSEYVCYVEQLRRFETLFSPEQVLVLVYDDFRSDNEGVVRRVLRFLDVDDTAPIELVEANPTFGVRSRRLHQVVHAVSVGAGPISAGAKRAIKTLVPGQLRRSALHATQRRLLYGDPQPLDEAFMRELRARFRPHVAAVAEHLDRDLLALWGYDGEQ